MANQLAEALKNIGLVKEEDLFKEYEKYSEIKLPFGSCTHNSDNEIIFKTEFHQKVFDGINYIRKTAKPITHSEYSELIKEIVPTYWFYLLYHNLDKVKIITQGGYQKQDHTPGKLGVKDLRNRDLDDYNLKENTPYGFSDLVYYFRFDHHQMRLRFMYSPNNLSPYQSDIKEELNRYIVYNGISLYEYKYFDSYLYFEEGYSSLPKETKIVVCNKIKSILFDNSEFIPLYIDKNDGVRLSNYKKGRNAITSPCLGINIKKHEKIMSRLEDWITNGGYIKDDVFYCIYQNRNAPEQLYLKRYEKWSPRPERKEN